MSDEERKAVENLKTEYEKLIKEDNILFPLYKSEAKRLLNLIEKQSKEIEELKADKYGLEEEVQIQAKQLIEIDGNYISKEESEQKERKAYIKGTNDADELCNKKWEDKIKAKTIEIKNRQVKDEFITASQGKLNTIIDMESLLEKE